MISRPMTKTTLIASEPSSRWMNGNRQVDATRSSDNAQRTNGLAWNRVSPNRLMAVGVVVPQTLDDAIADKLDELINALRR